jgi:sugar lactone lactonase YvrE
MKKTAILIVLFALPFGIEAQMGPIRKVEEVWSSSPDLDVPESVLYDQEREALYVSNINGKPTEKNGKGYIAKMTLEGSIGDIKWISGLNAPKGMALRNDTLYVADVDRVVLIDMKHGSIAAKYGTRKAEFLNDVTVAPSGSIYISDMKDRRIYRLRDGQLKSWKHGKALAQVNGLHWHKGTLYAGTQGRILAIDPSDRSITTVVDGTPSVDGLIAGVKNGFLFTDWEGRLFYAQQGEEPVTLNDTRDQGQHAADIGFKADEERVYVPTFFDNRVFAYELKTEE